MTRTGKPERNLHIRSHLIPNKGAKTDIGESTTCLVTVLGKLDIHMQ
jgi:hypothetical protein